MICLKIIQNYLQKQLDKPIEANTKCLIKENLLKQLITLFLKDFK